MRPSIEMRLVLVVLAWAVGELTPVGAFAQAPPPKPAATQSAASKPTTAKATTPAPASAEFPLETITITGNKYFTGKQIIAVSGLKLGQPANKQVFDQARDRLAITGAFLDVQMSFAPAPSNTGYAGVIHVEETVEVYPVKFEDLPVPADALRAHLKKLDPLYGDRIPGTKEFLGRWTAEVNKKIKELAPDWTDQVQAKITPELEVLFRPSTSRPSIAEVRFVNNSVLPATLLQNTLNAVAIGIVYTEPVLRTMLETSVKPLYDARGRIRATFPKIDIEKHKNSDGIVPVITVNEGPSYSLLGVHLSGTDRPTKKLLEKFEIKPGDVADFDRIKEGQNRIESEFREQGYLNVKSKAERVIDDQKRTVDVTVVLQPGAQFTFGKLEIKGLDLLTEPLIRKAWSLQSGKPFNPEYPDKFLKYLRDEGVFENLGETRAEKDIDEKSRIVNVALYFKGAAAEKKKFSGRPKPEPTRPIEP